MSTRERRPYTGRREAGDTLASAVRDFFADNEESFPSPVVLGLPRGGVPVAERVSKLLGAPLDIIVVRKLGVPRQREVAMGALAVVGDTIVRVEHTELMRVLREQGVSQEELDQVEAVELAELRRRQSMYRGDAPDLNLHGHTAVLVDDGLATGATMLAALRAARGAGANRLVVAVPVALRGASAMCAQEADAIVCPWEANLPAIGLAYDPFTQVEDAEVREILGRSRTDEQGQALEH